MLKHSTLIKIDIDLQGSKSKGMRVEDIKHIRVVMYCTRNRSRPAAKYWEGMRCVQSLLMRETKHSTLLHWLLYAPFQEIYNRFYLVISITNFHHVFQNLI